MLNGKDFGRAIDIAIRRKLENRTVATKAAIARHFGIKPPSLSDWVKKGSVAKDKLPELWRYFSDVAGPDHWGMSDDEWPSGLPLSGFTNYMSSAERQALDAHRADELGVLVGADRVVRNAVPRVQAIITSLLAHQDDERLLDTVERVIGLATAKPTAKPETGPSKPVANTQNREKNHAHLAKNRRTLTDLMPKMTDESKNEQA